MNAAPNAAPVPTPGPLAATSINNSSNMKTMQDKKIISILVFGLLLLGCERNIINRSSVIKIGDYNNMIVNYYDTILIGGYGSPHLFNLDLDNNGIDDVQFESIEWGSAAAGHHPKSTISCLNSDIELYGFFTTDTLYYWKSTHISEGINGTFNKYEYWHFTCIKINENDSIVEISPTFKILPLNRKEALKMDNTFNSGTFTLIDDPYTLPGWPIINIADTTIYIFEEYYNNCNTFPMDNIKYIGLRLYKKHLGWIKVSIFDKNKILIHESGILE